MTTPTRHRKTHDLKRIINGWVIPPGILNWDDFVKFRKEMGMEVKPFKPHFMSQWLKNSLISSPFDTPDNYLEEKYGFYNPNKRN